mmetsp:Transcript_50519/g.94125  ORF Transcript_50519/g.94125 Transcript_50519/m.94125 type:complete len:107 (+) Transcript_50519:983-1303(+)
MVAVGPTAPRTRDASFATAERASASLPTNPPRTVLSYLSKLRNRGNHLPKLVTAQRGCFESSVCRGKWVWRVRATGEGHVSTVKMLGSGWSKRTAFMGQKRSKLYL